MEQIEATRLRDSLKRELDQIDIVRFSILPRLVIKEIQRLDEAKKPPYVRMCGIKVPLLDGKSVLNMLLLEFELSSAEETEKLKQDLNSELDALSNSAVEFPKFIQKVIGYMEEYIKIQRLNESHPEDNQIAAMDYGAAIQKKYGLLAERNIIRNRAREKAFYPYYLLQLIDAECERLSDDIWYAVLLRSRDEIKIPVDGEFMLSRIPAEYDLSCAAETQKFIQNLEKEELNRVMSLGEEEFPLTLKFIQTVISYVERLKMENPSSEGAVCRSTTDNQTKEITEHSESTKRRRM